MIHDTFPSDSLDKIRGYLGNSRCCDCSSLDTNWASVSHGTLICLECAGKHRSLGVHVSFVRSITMDSWSAHQVEMLKQGGNGQIRRYFERTELKDKSISELYCSDAAETYRQILSEKVDNIMKGSGGSRKFSQSKGPSSMITRSVSSSSGAYSVTFGEGTMGMTLTKDRKDVAIVSRLVADGVAETSGVIIGDIVIGVNDKIIQHYDLIMHEISSSPRPVCIRFNRCNQIINTTTTTSIAASAPTKVPHFPFCHSRSEPSLLDTVGDDEMVSPTPSILATSPEQLPNHKLSDGISFDVPHSTSLYQIPYSDSNSNNNNAMSFIIPRAPSNDTVESNNTNNNSHDQDQDHEHTASIPTTTNKTKNLVKVLKNSINNNNGHSKEWYEGMITRIHRNNTFQIIYNESGKVEKYVESDRIALLPAIQYDAKITKYVTSYYDTESNGSDNSNGSDVECKGDVNGNGNGNGSNGNATSIQDELKGLSIITSLLPPVVPFRHQSKNNTPNHTPTNSQQQYYHHHTHSNSSMPSSPAMKNVLLDTPPLGFTLGKGLTGEALVIRVIPQGHADIKGITIGDILQCINFQSISNYDEAMVLLIPCTYPINLSFAPLPFTRNNRMMEKKYHRPFHHQYISSEPSSPIRGSFLSDPYSNNTYINTTNNSTSSSGSSNGSYPGSLLNRLSLMDGEFNITINQSDLGFEIIQDSSAHDEEKQSAGCAIVSVIRENSQVRKCGVRIGYAVVAVDKHYYATYTLLAQALGTTKRPIAVTFRKC